MNMIFLNAEQVKNKMFVRMVPLLKGGERPLYKVVKDRKGIFADNEKAFFFVEMKPVVFRSKAGAANFDTYKITLVPSTWSAEEKWAVPEGESIIVHITKVDYDSLTGRQAVDKGDLVSVQGKKYMSKQGYEQVGRLWTKLQKVQKGVTEINNQFPEDDNGEARMI